MTTFDPLIPETSARVMSPRKRRMLESTDPFVFIGFCLLGLSSWIAINGIFQEIQLIAKEVPEGYALYSYASICVALANIFPILYVSIIPRFFRRNQAFLDSVSVFVIVGIVGTSTCILLSSLWNHQTMFAGENQSVALMLLMFTAGAVDCMTSVIFFPIVGRYKSVYVSALNIGEALTGLIAALMALAQTGPDADSINFSVSVYFGLLAIVTTISTGSYAFILFSDRGKMALNHRHFQSSSPTVSLHGIEIPETHPEEALIRPAGEDENKIDHSVPLDRKNLFHLPSAYLFFLSFLENGLLVTVPPSALSPFKDSAVFLSTSVKLGFGGAAFASYLAFFLRFPPHRKTTSRIVISVVTIAMSLCIFFLALFDFGTTSPSLGQFTTAIIIMCKWIIAFGKTSVLLDMHDSMTQSGDSELKKTLFRWGGSAIQAGSLVGALTFFTMQSKNVFNHMPFPIS